MADAGWQPEPRVIPALPSRDPELGEIRWEREVAALTVSHVPSHCQSCAYPGPLRTAQGLTLYQERPYRELVRRSRIAEGKRAVAGKVVTPEPRWVFSHWARRCPACDEMTVWRREGWVEIAYHPYTTRCVSPAQPDTLF